MGKKTKSRRTKRGTSYYRRFGGELYFFYSFHKKKRIANIEAGALRNKGWKVRVIPIEDGYALYRRKG